MPLLIAASFSTRRADRIGAAARSQSAEVQVKLRFNESPANAGRRKTQLVLADQVIVSGANFVIGFLLARALGPSGYGQYTLTFNLIMFVLGIQIALINSPMMVLGAAVPKEREAQYFPAVMIGQLALCLVAGSMLLLGVPVLRHFAPQWSLEGLSWPLLFAMSAYLCQDFGRRYLFVRDRAHAALVVDMVTHGSKFALLVALAFWGVLNAGAAFWIIGATSSIGIALALKASFQRESWLAPTASSFKRMFSEHWKFGKWLIAEGMAYWCGSQMVIYVAGEVVSLSAVGAMAAALHIVGATNVLLLALENLVPSRAAQAYVNRGGAALNAYLWRISLLGGIGTLAIVAVAVLGAEFWLRLLYGSAYAGNGHLIWWWGVYYVLGFVQRPFSIGLRVLGHTQGIFHATLAGALVALAVSYPATRALGVDGAMLSICLVQAAILCILAFSYRAASRARD